MNASAPPRHEAVAPDPRGGGVHGAAMVVGVLALIGFTLQLAFPHQRTVSEVHLDGTSTAHQVFRPDPDATRLDPGRFRPVVADAFERSDAIGGLATTPGGVAWRIAAGEWRVRNDQAQQTGRPERAIAIVDTGAPAGLLQVSMVAVAPGTGLVFGFEDLRNYWMMVSAPSLRTWTVLQVTDGRDEVQGDLGPSLTGPATRISVEFGPGEAHFFVNGVEGLAMAGPGDAGSTDVGLVALSESEGAGAWDDFAFGLPRQGPGADGP